MLKLLCPMIFAVAFTVGCASGNAPLKDDDNPSLNSPDSLEPLGDGKPVCGWSDTGRWECSKGRAALDKKGKSKVTTKFKKAQPPKEQESKLPRGDTPFDASPVEDSSSPSSSSDDDMD